MKNKHNEGFSLVETLVSITILALIVIPVCSGLIMSFRMNAKTNSLMQAQLAVSSAVETLMAEGIEDASEQYDIVAYDVVQENGNVVQKQKDRFPEVTVKTEKVDGKPYFKVTVISTDGEVSVTTYIRPADFEEATEPSEETDATDQSEGGGT